MTDIHNLPKKDTKRDIKRDAKKGVLITGAGRGLGHALALHWSQKPVHLMLHANSSLQAVEEIARQAQSQGSQVEVLQADLSQPAAREGLFAQVRKCCPSLCLLINNAAVFRSAPFDKWEASAFSNTLEVNCAAVHHLILLAQDLLRRGAPSSIINIGDAAADRITAHSNDPAYHISKLGVNVLTRSFAQQLAPAGIRVNMVSPGMLHNSLKLPTDDKINFPLKRKGSFRDVISAIDYLCSPPAEYISGANVTISGGWNL